PERAQGCAGSGWSGWRRSAACPAGPGKEPLSAPAVQLESVSFTYPGASSPAVENVNLEVPEGTRLGILGPNGGGKSTLLKIALGLLKPTSGRVRILGRDPAEARRAGLIGYVPQKVDAELGFPMSVRQ